MVKVLIMMADYGHDPTETVVPYSVFQEAGFEINFATETGTSPKCDAKMLEGITQTIFGASRSVIRQYAVMVASEEWKHASAWSVAGFDLGAFDIVFLPGGQEKTTRQLIDSPVVHKLLADYFPQTRKPAGKAVGAICYGVKVLAKAKRPDGRSILYGCTTTTLPAVFEKLAFWVTRPFMGDYFKVYGASSENVEDSVLEVLSDPGCLKSSWTLFPFVVEDPNFNYASARHPGDAQLLAERLVNIIAQSRFQAPLDPSLVTGSQTGTMAHFAFSRMRCQDAGTVLNGICRVYTSAKNENTWVQHRGAQMKPLLCSLRASVEEDLKYDRRSLNGI